MTGFGRAEISSAFGPVRVEIKTTNHKFLELSLRLPPHLGEFEDPLRKIVTRELGRGKVTVFVSSQDPATYSTRLRLNEDLAREVVQKISRLGKILNVKQERAQVMSEVLRFPDVLTREGSYQRRPVFSGQLQKAVVAALKNLRSSREREGRELEKDLSVRLGEIRRALALIEKRIPAVHALYKKNLQAKLGDFMKTGDIDRDRLTLEVAQYVKNSDVSEEIARLKSHLAGMKKTFGESGEVGRKIDFIAQEMTREANTLGAKSNDTVLADGVIKIKSAIEKIREQAQNLE